MTRRRFASLLLRVPAGPAAFAALAAMAPRPARAERGEWSAWAFFRDTKGKDLGVDFRWTTEEFDIPPNSVWFQFRNRRKDAVRINWELMLTTETSERTFRGEFTLNPNSLSPETERPGNTLKRVNVRTSILPPSRPK